jgi:hypothetical protein
MRARTGRRKEAGERTGLRNRIRSFYRNLNQGKWERCFGFVDPTLREEAKVEQPRYTASLARFRQRYGNIEVFPFTVSVHSGRKNKHDPRDFAFAYVAWKDAKGNFRLFRERWVRDRGRWYTRVVGLVTHDPPS